MHKHLQHVHKRSADSIVKTPAQAKVQSTLVAWQQSRKTLTSQRYESINKSLAIMCATDLRPTSIVNGEGFKRFVNKLNPDYQVPSKKTVTKYVTLAYEECKQLLRAAISGKDVALTTDLWTSHQRSYITVTAHYLTTDWQLKVNVLATRPIDDRHTGQNIAKHLKAIADEFGIRISAIVTDNASNMVRAAQEGNMPRVGCFAHTIQLCVNDGLEKQRRVSKAISTGKRVVTHFSHSNLSTQALLDQQAIMDPSQKAVKLVQDVATRWNSSFLMMQRLLRLRIPLYAVLCNDKIISQSDRMSLDMDDGIWKIMEDVIPVLEPFAEVTEMLSREDLPTSSSIMVLVPTLLAGLSVNELDSGAIAELKQIIKRGFITRFNLNADGEPTEETLRALPMTATFLDPRYKALKFLTPMMRETVQDHIVSLMDQVNQAPHTAVVKVEPTESELDVVPAKKMLLDCLRGDVVDLTDDTAPTSSELELESYITERVIIPDSLLWWSQHMTTFPKLAALARIYLAVPGTEVPSERAFSVAGLTVTNLRASLDPKNVDQLTFLHKNYQFPISVVPASPAVPAANTPKPHTVTTATATAVEVHTPPQQAVSTKAESTRPNLPTLDNIDSD